MTDPILDNEALCFVTPEADFRMQWLEAMSMDVGILPFT